MTVHEGMDPARVRQISGQLDADAARLADILGRGNASAGVLAGNWDGADGAALLTRWRGEAATRLGEAGTMLRDLSRELGVQADQQDAASGGSGGGPQGGGAGGPGGDGGGPRGQGTDGQRPEDRRFGNGYDVTGRGPDAAGVRQYEDGNGNTHYDDPVTGKRWVEDADGRWTRVSDPTGHSGLTTQEPGRGPWERESTRGDGGGHRDYGESWTNERTFDRGRLQTPLDVLDHVQSEPIVERELWRQEAGVAVAGGQVGDDRLGAGGEVLSARAATEANAGIDPVRGAYVEATAEAGAYLARGEAHWVGEHGTTAQAEGYVGAQVEAEMGANIGPGGAQVDAGIGGFAGGRIEGGISQDLGPADVGVSGALSYGIGAHADVGAEASWDRVGVSVDIGATLGIGATIEFDVSVSPSEIVEGAGDVLEGAGDVAEDVGSFLNPFD